MTGRVYDTMLAYFQKIGWEYGEVGDGISVALEFKGSALEWRCVAQALESRNLFLFYSLCSVNAPPELRGEAAEFVTRANYSLLEGAFEQDMDDGELRFRTSVSLERLPDDAWPDLARTLIGEAVQSNLLTMDEYAEGLLAVASGSATGAEAIAAAED